MKNCIYKLTSPSGKVYIGQCIDFEQRKRQHINRSKNPKTSIERAINKYGFHNFSVEFIHVLPKYDRECLNEKEKYFIQKHKTMDPNIGYNLCEGGEGRKGPLSFSTKQKMSVSKMGKQSNRKNTPTSDETRRKMSESHRRPHSDFQKRRMAEGLSIPIEQYSLDGSLVKVWSSAKQAMTETGITTVRDVLHGRQKTGGGFIWKYVDKDYKPSVNRRKLFDIEREN
jgi:group I intron endonuclease